MGEALDGIAAADERLGVPFPLPTLPLRLARWVEVHEAGPRGAEVEWNLDDSRAGSPGRLALYVGHEAPAAHALDDAVDGGEVPIGTALGRLRRAPLAHAQASLRPVTELTWRDGTLHLRLTGQGPWIDSDLLALAASIPSRRPASPV